MTTKVELTQEQRAALYEEFEKERMAKEAIEKEKVASYRNLVSETLVEIFAKLENAGAVLKAAKRQAFEDLETLLVSKGEVFEVSENQKSYTFTSRDSKLRIVMGVRTISRWDGTETAGITMIENYVKSKVKDANSAELVSMLMILLKRDKQGNLNPGRVMDINSKKDEFKSEEINKGIEIILSAYQPTESQRYLNALRKNETSGKFENIETNWEAIEAIITEIKEANNGTVSL